jgi:hypothetical protein
MAWQQRPSEELLLHQLIVEVEPIPGAHANVAHLVTFEHGSQAVFKPKDGEVANLRRTISAGTYWRREVAAFRLDRLLNFNLVPTTVAIDIDGDGSLQAFQDQDGRGVDEYAAEDREMMGALDYLIANTDRHSQNWMTQNDGRPAATDNGLAFPLSNMDALNSPWIRPLFNLPLSDSIVQAIRAMDQAIAGDVLRELGIEEEAISAFTERLAEARSGTITGRAWFGSVM